MNQLLIAAGAVLIGIGVLTPKKESDKVESPNANDVPKTNETETQTDNVDDSGITDSGEPV
jgi:hypothetical protein